MKRLSLFCCAFICASAFSQNVFSVESPPPRIAPYFKAPAEWENQLSENRSPLLFADGQKVRSAEDWKRRRLEILQTWHQIMGEWPPVLAHPELKILETSPRDNFTQHKIRLQVAAAQTLEGYLLIPEGKGPFPAVFVPFYQPETSVGIGGKPYRDFAYQLAKRGFVTLALGCPGGDAWNPALSPEAKCQPLSYLGYLSANVWQALSQRPEVDAARIGILGHSFGGKWSLFGSCLWEKYACAVWSDAGVTFDETRPSVNYWEPWYLGLDPKITRKRGLITAANPRTGAYKTLIEKGHDLVELESLMAPRPFLVSGGSEDFPARWKVLNHVVAVNQLLGVENRVAMTNRELHDPNAESNEQVYTFLEWALRVKRGG